MNDAPTPPEDAPPRDRRPSARYGPPAPWEMTASPAEMRRLGWMVGSGVGLVAFLLFFVVDIDLGSRKVRQQVDRAMRDMLLAEAAIARMGLSQEGLPQAVDGVLPPEFSQRYADLHGGAPFYQELGRLARLDMFHPDGPHRGPMRFHRDGGHWILLSRGPNLAYDTPEGYFPDRQSINLTAYDPTNGAASAGDLWVGRPGPAR